MALNPIRIQRQYVKPYSFEKTTRRIRSDEECLYQEEDGILFRAVEGERGPILLLIAEDEANACIDITIYGRLNEGEEKRIGDQWSNILSMKSDLSPIYDRFSSDPYLFEIFKQREGMHWVLTPTLFECLISTIISQQLNQTFAATLKRRLIAVTGKQMEFQQKIYPLFPDAEQIASLQVDDLRKLQFSQRKAEYIIDIARKVVDGILDLEKLRSYTNEEIMDYLLPIRGIGKWTVECFLLFGLGRKNVLPAADIGLRHAIQKVYRRKKRPPEEEVRKMGQSWSPFQSYVTIYLWDYLSKD